MILETDFDFCFVPHFKKRSVLECSIINRLVKTVKFAFKALSSTLLDRFMKEKLRQISKETFKSFNKNHSDSINDIKQSFGDLAVY